MYQRWQRSTGEVFINKLFPAAHTLSRFVGGRLVRGDGMCFLYFFLWEREAAHQHFHCANLERGMASVNPTFQSLSHLESTQTNTHTHAHIPVKVHTFQRRRTHTDTSPPQSKSLTFTSHIRVLKCAV